MTNLPLPSGTGYTILALVGIAIIVLMFVVAQVKDGSGGKVVISVVKSIFRYTLDAPFVYIKVAFGFAILRWIGWI